jgi:outer membrane cobalamin receptor
MSGELRLHLKDAGGLYLEAQCTLVSQSSGVRKEFTTDAAHAFFLHPLPFGLYQLTCRRSGFQPVSTGLEVRTETPVERTFIMGVQPVETALIVRDDDTLLDPSRAGSQQNVGSGVLRDRRSAAPGRGVLEMVNTQPGWLLEANGVLHPRGSEYDVQYVIDGVPLLDNRSPAFAQSLGIEEFESMKILTGGYPAEFGRKLGGVIEVVTNRESRQGWHGKTILQGGSFAARNGFFSGQYTAGKTTAGLSAEGLTTDRYLDAPVEENFTNRASGGGFSARLERDWTSASRTRFYGHSRSLGFLVPNERLQQAAGQRQDRTAGETMAYVSHGQVFTPSMIGSFRAMGRDTGGRLWSNELSTPIQPFQDRGFREAYGLGSVSYHRGRHEIKGGGEASYNSIREQFRYRITQYEVRGVEIFDGDLPQRFLFDEGGRGKELALFAQDLIRWGRLTLQGGLRYDRYNLKVRESAWSPRAAAALHFPSAGLLLRGSYDRVFQTPAVENILLASANLIGQLTEEGMFLPLRPSRGNFYEAGFSKSLFAKLRLDGVWFRRSLRNFADDSLLLNTGVSFPIAFESAEIRGFEVKLEAPRWGRFSGWLSYSNLSGRGFLPVAGGLFLGDEAEELAALKGSFPITQDQRNTVRARLRVELPARLWLASMSRYDSGLPVELEGASEEDLLESQYGEAILERVNFHRGRVRPSASLDFSVGAALWHKERRSLSLQGDIINTTNRLNVINFSGLFSGTAIEPRRTFAVRLQAEF